MKNKKRKTLASLLMILAISCAAMFAGTITASAAGLGTAGIVPLIDTSGIISWINEAQTALKAIGYGIAGIAVIALGILMIGGGSQGLQKGKGMAISILVGVAVIGLGVGVLGSLQK